MHFFSTWPSWLATIALSMVPTTEMQLAIPMAIHSWSIPPTTAVAYALIGNALVFLPLYFGLERVRAFFAVKAPKLVRPIDMMLARGKGSCSNSTRGMAPLHFCSLPRSRSR